MSTGNWRDKWKGKKLVNLKFEIRHFKNANQLTLDEFHLWAGWAYDFYLLLEPRSQDTKVNFDIRRCDYQTSQILRQCHSIIKLLLHRLAQRDQVITQKDEEIKRLNVHIAELLNRPML